MRRHTLSAAVIVALIVGLLSTVPAEATTVSAKALLGEITDAPESSQAYSRTAFKHWTDDDRDGCDTREEVLLAESVVRAALGANCRITRGRWVSWYDGRTWTQSSDVDIDHMVSLKEAWDSGAARWTAADRSRFANDLAFASSLVAVTDNVNQSKSDRDPAEWLPAKQRCRYATDWLRVKYRWHLTMDARERRSLSSILIGACGSKQVKLPMRMTIGSATPVPSPTTLAVPAPPSATASPLGFSRPERPH